MEHKEYFSPENETRFMSNHQWKDWLACEARAKAQYIDHTYKQPDRDAFIIGRLFEAIIQGRESEFKETTPTAYNKKGELYEKYKIASEMAIKTVNDGMMRRAMSGESQVAFTGEIAGLPWKCLVDYVQHDKEAVIEIKTTKDFDQCWAFLDEKNKKVEWYEEYNYWRQIAVQRELVFQKTGKYYKMIVAAVTKQDPPDIELLAFENEARIQLELMEIQSKTSRIKALLEGIERPIRCGKCDYCRATKEIKEIKKATSIY